MRFDFALPVDHQQEADAVRGQPDRAALLPAGAGRGLLLCPRVQRREAELQGHRAALYLRAAAHPAGHAAVHRGISAHDRWVVGL